MFKARHLVLVAALAMVAIGAMAGNFSAGDQVYVPASGRVTSFTSDVWVKNMSATESVTVSVIYIPGNHPSRQAVPEYFNDAFTIPPGQQREFLNFFETPRSQGGLGKQGFGALIFNACLAGADCINTADPTTGISPFYRNISVFSRIYSTAGPPGTRGQAFPGLPWYNYASMRASQRGLSRVVISGLRQGAAGGDYRSNIGVMNASQFSSTQVVIRLFNGATGQQIGGDHVENLGPLNMVQLNGLTGVPEFGAGAASVTNAFVTVEQISSTPTNDAPAGCQSDGCPGFFAYGAVLDNQGSDPTTLPAIYELPLDAFAGALDAIYGSTSTGSGANIRRSVRRGQ